MMTAQKAYHSFALQNDLSLFFQEWYLDHIYGKGLWTCNFYEEENQILAIWIYSMSKFGPIKYVALPTLIKYTGLCFADHVKASEYELIYNQLLEELPQTVSWIQQLTINVHLFINQIDGGFMKQSRTSYNWNLRKSSEVLLQDMDGNYRRAINKFLPEITDNTNVLATSVEITNFIELLEDSMGDLSIHSLQSKNLEKLILDSERRNQGKLLLLYQDKELVSGSFFVWDDEKAYYLLAGNKSEFKKIYPGVLMAFSSAMFLQTKSILTLDFLGSDIDSIAKIWKKIGATKMTYTLIKKEYSWFGILKKILRK